ncbi:molecular chaperone [Shewanella sp. YIC-542]|uniref:TorD/DmsD family molecular chaperone n=1 Tax=Shewanella mytili TaxID=3377111 RepID=UPI00398E3AA6
MMDADFGPVASAYQAFKGMMFAPSKPESLQSLILWLEQQHPCSSLLTAARQYADQQLELECDFNRMCIGPYRLLVPPYESVYRTSGRQINTDETVAVADFYQRIGLVPHGGLNEPADFIGNELEFLFCLEALRHQEQDAEVAAELEQWATDFMAAHLGLWYQEFTQGIETHAQTEFWRLYAIELREFLTSRTAPSIPEDSAPQDKRPADA